MVPGSGSGRAAHVAFWDAAHFWRERDKQNLCLLEKWCEGAYSVWVEGARTIILVRRGRLVVFPVYA